MIRFRVGMRTMPPRATSIVVAGGALELAAKQLAREFRSHLLVVVSDSRVARLLARRFVRRLTALGADVVLLRFPAGERSKTRETKASIEDRLLLRDAGRDTVIVALGGGVTGDLAGFVAATWHRGVPFVVIPTSLLAMVDAALGGKTAVDLPGGKNLVGAFHQPTSLWADVRALRTLPDRHYRDGLSEAVKTAVALDASLFRRLERDAQRLVRRDESAIARVIGRCLALKGRVVAADERDSGRRAVLNFGHTVAHALEAATDYRVSHGRAVAIGIVAEARLAERLTGFPRSHADRIEALLAAFGLPVRSPLGIEPIRWVRAMRRDKKTRAGVVRCALPERIGKMLAGGDPTVPVDPVRDLLPLLVRD